MDVGISRSRSSRNLWQPEPDRTRDGGGGTCDLENLDLLVLYKARSRPRCEVAEVLTFDAVRSLRPLVLQLYDRYAIQGASSLRVPWSRWRWQRSTRASVSVALEPRC